MRRRSLRWPYDANDKTMIVELYVANDHSQVCDRNQLSWNQLSCVNHCRHPIWRRISLYTSLLETFRVQLWTSIVCVTGLLSRRTTAWAYLEGLFPGPPPLKWIHPCCQSLKMHKNMPQIIGKNPEIESLWIFFWLLLWATELFIIVSRINPPWTESIPATKA